MIDETIGQLIEFLQEVSPLIWATLIKQTYVDALAYIVWAIGLAVLCVILFKVGNYGKIEAEKDPHSMWEVFSLFSYIGLFGTGTIAFSMLIAAFTRFANPEFYAIRYILQQIGCN